MEDGFTVDPPGTERPEDPQWARNDPERLAANLHEEVDRFKRGSGARLEKPKEPEFGDVLSLADRLKWFFTQLAGMDPRVMSQCQPDEQSKAWKIGLTLLLPSMLAMLGGGYTLWTLTQSVGVAIFAAPIWAGAIFILDLAVMPLLTHDSDGSQNGGHYRTGIGRLRSAFKGSRWSVGIVRLMIALLLGALVSHSLMLFVVSQRIFTEIEDARSLEIKQIEDEWEIQSAQLLEQKPQLSQEEISRAANTATSEALTLDIDAVDSEIEASRARREVVRDQMEALRLMIAEEILDGRHSGTNLGRCGPYCLGLKQNLGALKEELSGIKALDARKDDLQGQIERERGSRASSIRGARQGVINQHAETLQSWQVKYDAAEERIRVRQQGLSPEAQPRRDLLFQSEFLGIVVAESSSALYLVVLLFGAILMLDLAPLILKLLRRPGEYDERVSAAREVEIQSLSQHVTNELQIRRLRDTITHERAIAELDRTRRKLADELEG